MALRFSRVSLRARLLALVGIAVVPALAVILYTGLEFREKLAGDARRFALRTATSTSAVYERVVRSIHLSLRTFSLAPIVQRKDWAACSAFFAKLLKQFPRYLNLGVVGTDGIIRCSGLPMESPVDASSREYFQQAMESRGFGGGVYQIGTITKKASINFGQAVLDGDGRVQGVMFAALDLGWLMLTETVGPLTLPPGASATLIDRQGVVLGRLPDRDGWAGRPLPEAALVQRVSSSSQGVMEWRGEDGIRRLIGFARLGEPASGLYVLVDIPVAAAVAEANWALERNLLLLGFLGLFAFAAAWIGGKWFLEEPIGRLLASARRMAEGDLKARTGLPHEGAELNGLARAFDEMAGALENAARENHRKQELVFRSEKLATLGVLMAGAAHEILNPANIVGLHAQRLIRDHPAGSPEQKSGEVMWASVQRITDICGGLRRFSRDDAPKAERLSPTQVADDCFHLLAHKLRLASVRVKREFEDGGAQVLGDRNRFMQIFLNIISNAADAMPGSGTLTLRTLVAEEEGKRWWEGRFTDTGAGIAPEVMPRIFDPFFTTKPEDKGTGLGLPVSRQIAEAHGGKLWAESPPGAGAAFILRFPLAGG